MVEVQPIKVEFCGGCGYLLPIEDERPLFPPDFTPGCPSCHTRTEKVKVIVGYFSPTNESRLRGVAS